jgi:predicted nucleic acid-binding protein
MAAEIKVYLDACCFIDLAKQAKGVALTPERDEQAWFASRILEAAKDGKVKVFTSGFTLVECVGVRESDDQKTDLLCDDEVKRIFSSILASGRSGVIPVQPDYFITEAARDLYWKHKVTCRPADRLHLATAISIGCSEFMTLDGRIGVTHRKLAKRHFNLSVISPKETVLLPNEYRQLRLTDHE